MGNGQGQPDDTMPVSASDDDTEGLDPAGQATLRWLRWLVTGLALTMGVGILVIAALLWVRLGPGGGAPAMVPATVPGQIPQLPAGFMLPDGVRATAVTFSQDWVVVVSDAGEVLIFDQSGNLHQRAHIAQPRP